VEAEAISGGKLPTTVRFTPKPMEAVTPPLTGVQTEPFAFLDAATLEDPIPASSSSQDVEAVPSSPAAMIGAPAFDPRPGIVAFAGFGLVPEKLSEMPAYALRVLARRILLRAGLEVARARRAQDVELYQAALVAADGTAVRKGLVLLAMMVSAAIGAIALAFALLM
jgi:hypothetical protein